MAIFSKESTLFVKKNSIIEFSQWELRQARSTELTILEKQQQYIPESFEKQMLTHRLLIDFSKGFDRASHKTLTTRLNRYDIRGVPLDLVKSYLSLSL